MPVIAVAGMYMGATALAAGGLTAFGTIAAIGSIVSGIGALTGNETMMKVGGIASLAGGIGAFAQGKGWIGTEAGQSMGDGGNIKALTGTTAPGMENVNPTDMRLAAGTQQTPMDGAFADAGATAGLDSGISQNITQANSLVSGQSAGGLFDAANPTLTGGSQTSPLTSDVVGSGPITSLTKQVAPADTGSIFSKLKNFSNFLNENKELSSMAGNFIGGALDDRRKAETDLLEARAATERQQLANGNAVPRLGMHLKPQTTIFRPSAPTYNAPRPSGLFYAK